MTDNQTTQPGALSRLLHTELHFPSHKGFDVTESGQKTFPRSEAFDPKDMHLVTQAAFKAYPQPDAAERQYALWAAVHHLEEVDPDLVAKKAFVRWQIIAMAVVAGLCGIGLAIDLYGFLTFVSVVLIFLYLGVLVARAKVFFSGVAYGEAGGGAPSKVLPDDALPMYTILMPAYDEPEVIKHLVHAVNAIDYPHDRLELLLLLEEDDESTLKVLLTATLPDCVRVLLVPAGEPRTKPKACNYGLYFARGEYVTIYDAEDAPSHDQLRLAASKFAEAGSSVACIQARLDYFNERQNLLTRWFAIEYITWFSVFLPGLFQERLPIPLGGTSNHLRTDLLQAVGGWDPFNVTEDADLGLRLARRGYVTEVLSSITDEEATSDVVNWVRQRSRWYKGYLQTWLVHMRHPRTSYQELGSRGALGATLLIGLTPILAALNLFTWLCAAMFFIGVPPAIAAVFPSWLVYLGTLGFVLGNVLVMYISLMAVIAAGRPGLIWAVLLYPVYWLLMAVAAVKAVWQLIFKPSYWEKTAHGFSGALDTTDPHVVDSGVGGDS